MIRVRVWNISVSKINSAPVFLADETNRLLKAPQNNGACSDDVRRTTAAQALDEKREKTTETYCMFPVFLFIFFSLSGTRTPMHLSKHNDKTRTFLGGLKKKKDLVLLIRDTVCKG